MGFDYPEANVRGLTWLGDGPHRVYKNRLRGVSTDVWTKQYNNTATGASGFQYPEFKGYHARTYWAALSTTEGTITMVAAEENLFLRLFTPAVGVDPKNATAPYPPRVCHSSMAFRRSGTSSTVSAHSDPRANRTSPQATTTAASTSVSAPEMRHIVSG
ncbi:hypothetical protein NKG94_50510 [Micromonospora sp. M12]